LSPAARRNRNARRILNPTPALSGLPEQDSCGKRAERRFRQSTRRANSREGASRSFAGKGNQSASARRPKKDGLASGGWWNVALRVSPLEWGAPHEVGAQGKTFPCPSVPLKGRRADEFPHNRLARGEILNRHIEDLGEQLQFAMRPPIAAETRFSPLTPYSRPIQPLETSS
jgi:hypothetical protein